MLLGPLGNAADVHELPQLPLLFSLLGDGITSIHRTAFPCRLSITSLKLYALLGCKAEFDWFLPAL